MLQRICGLAFLCGIALAACTPERPQDDTTAAKTLAAQSPAMVAMPSPPLVRAARSQVGATRFYDPAYVRLAYPGGDVPFTRGVCTDVVIRALRTQGIDLQQRIHEDRLAHPERYPSRWRGLAADRNIDHRRVPNQMVWFDRQGWRQPITMQAADYRPGDIVAWDLGRGILHIGIVSDRTTHDRIPLILHNIGSGTQEENLLFDYEIIGHYRPALSVAAR